MISDKRLLPLVPGIVFLWTLLAIAASARADDPVRIDHRPAVVTFQTFDPKHPPATMPALKDDEAAITSSKYGCQASMAGAILNPQNAGGDWAVDVKIDTVNVQLQLDVVEWLPTDAPDKLKAHEEGHRKIAELSYDDSGKTAAALAAKYIGKIVRGQGNSQEAAADAAIKSAIDSLNSDYIQATAWRAGHVQELYDDLTAHGTNKTPEAEAIKRALEIARNEDAKKRP